MDGMEILMRIYESIFSPEMQYCVVHVEDSGLLNKQAFTGEPRNGWLGGGTTVI